MVNLNNLIGDAVKDYRLDSATAINDKGQIAAVAYVNSAAAFHAVLLTPVVEVSPTDEITASATYAAKQRLLTVRATSTGGAPGTTPPTLSVYAGGYGEKLIGTLNTKDGSNYFGHFTMASSPQTITIGSSKGGRVDVKVEDGK